MIRRAIGKIARSMGLQPLPLRMDVLNSQIQQRQLQAQYRQLLAQGLPLPELSDAGFRVFSQNEEDGILHYIFSVIGATNRVCMEVAYGTPYGGNTTNLILNDGWKGILISGTEKEAAAVKRFFLTHTDSRQRPPAVLREWITAENINAIAEKGLRELDCEEKQIDLLSIDIDGVDYWVWKAIEAIEPRVVVLEFNPALRDRPVTVPYRADFSVSGSHPRYYGASLTALSRLGNQKGYRLAGTNRYGYNAFFIKRGAGDIIPEVSAADCLKKIPPLKEADKILSELQNMDWEEV